MGGDNDDCLCVWNFGTFSILIGKSYHSLSYSVIGYSIVLFHCLQETFSTHYPNLTCFHERVYVYVDGRGLSENVRSRLVCRLVGVFPSSSVL
jgi:hypothetical protein